MTSQQKVLWAIAASGTAAGIGLLLAKSTKEKSLIWDLLAIGAVSTAASVPLGIYLVPRFGPGSRWGWIPPVALTGLSYFVKYKMLPHPKSKVSKAVSGFLPL